MLAEEEFEISFLGAQASAPPAQECPWHCWDSTQAKTSGNLKKKKNTHWHLFTPGTLRNLCTCTQYVIGFWEFFLVVLMDLYSLPPPPPTLPNTHTLSESHMGPGEGD